VDANRIGSSSFEMKFLITCRMVSVDSTVEIPSLLPKSEARVLFPVPEVPASSTKILLLDSVFNDTDIILTNKVRCYIEVF
jgi:hypothetical protein